MMKVFANLFFISLLSGAAYAQEGTCSAGDEICSPGGNTSYSTWGDLVQDTIIANGNVWPPNPDLDKADNCMLVLSHSSMHRYCPKDDDKFDDGKGALDRSRAFNLFRGHVNVRFRGAFYVEGYKHRLWVLVSPSGAKKDFLEEIDIQTGVVFQTLRIPGTMDAHDAVRDGKSVFVVDTRNGDIVELELPKPAPPNTPPRLNKNDRFLDDNIKNAVVIKRHRGFTRIDHPNNVAIHKDLIVTSLHGGHFLKPSVQEMYPPSRSRISLLDRHETNTDELLKYDKSDFVIDTIGQSNHGIAFYKDPMTQEVKMLSLDTQSGTLVSIVVSPDDKVKRSKEILWEPDLDKDYFTPKTTGVLFAKGLAVQGNVAYFGFCAREGLRVPVYYTHLVLTAFDLVEKKELWSKSLEEPLHEKMPRAGVPNQIITMEYLNYDCMKLPDGDEKKVCFEWPDRKEW